MVYETIMDYFSLCHYIFNILRKFFSMANTWDICFYQILIDEVDNIDGYKVVFKNDKKISLE